MRATVPLRMSADAFLARAMKQPESERYEPVAGEIVAMAPERVGYGSMKFSVARRWADATDATGLTCDVFVDRMPARADTRTVNEPDVMVRCGRPFDDNAIEVNGPVILVEVVSPSSGKPDTGSKLDDDFRIPSVRRHLIVKTGNRAVIRRRQVILHCRSGHSALRLHSANPGAAFARRNARSITNR